MMLGMKECHGVSSWRNAGEHAVRRAAADRRDHAPPPIFGNAAGELNSAQRTTPSLFRAPLTVIDNLPADCCDRPAVGVNTRTSAATAATFARNERKANLPSQKHYRPRHRVTSATVEYVL